MEQYFASHAGPLLAVFLAAFLQSITGFGLVMIMAPLLMMFYEPKFAVILVIIIASCGNISQALMLRKETRYKTILWLFIGSLAGQPVGYLMYHLFPSEAVRLWVNLIVLFSITLMLICHWKIRQCTRNTAITGAISGITSISSGIGGPPLLIYFASTDMTPAVLRATSISFFAVGNVCVLISYVLGGVNVMPAIHEAVYLLPALAVGIGLGHFVFPHIPSKLFRKILLFVMYVICSYSVYTIFTQ